MKLINSRLEDNLILTSDVAFHEAQVRLGRFIIRHYLR